MTEFRAPDESRAVRPAILLTSIRVMSTPALLPRYLAAVTCVLLLCLLRSSTAQLSVGEVYGFETPSVGGSWSYSSNIANPVSTPGSTYIPFTLSQSAGLSNYQSIWSDTDATSYEGVQFAFLQDDASISTVIEGLEVYELYNVSFAYSNRNPVYADTDPEEPEPNSGNVTGLTLHVTVGPITIFSVTLNADLGGFVSASGTFVFSNASADASVLTFAVNVPGGDQSYLLDAVLVTQLTYSSSTGAASSSSSSGVTPIPPSPSSSSSSASLGSSAASPSSSASLSSSTASASSLPPPLPPCAVVYNITVSAMNGASAIADSGLGDLPTGVFVSADDVLEYLSYSGPLAWCTYCGNAAGSPSVLSNYQDMALVFRYGNDTSDSNQADFTPVFTYYTTPVTPQTSTFLVPSTLNGTEQLWLAAWDDGISDNFGSVTVLITHIPAVCLPSGVTAAGSSSTSAVAVGSSSAPSIAATSSLSAPAATLSSSSSSFSLPAPSSSTGSSSSVLGDPQFVGLLGQSFQVHGLDHAVYNLLVDGPLLVNARFRFLSSGRCPSTAAPPTNCWSHPGSYLGELGVVSPNHSRLHILSGAWDEGFASVTLDGEVVPVGANMTAPGIAVHLLSHYQLWLQSGNFELTIDNSDRFVNIAQLRVLHWSAVHNTHGLLGQTWQRRPNKHGGQVPYIEGDIDDYVEQNDDILGRALVYGVEQQ